MIPPPCFGLSLKHESVAAVVIAGAVRVDEKFDMLSERVRGTRKPFTVRLEPRITKAETSDAAKRRHILN